MPLQQREAVLLGWATGSDMRMRKVVGCRWGHQHRPPLLPVESCLLPQAWAAAAAAPAALPATVLRHMMVADVFSSPPAGLQGPQVPDHERAVHVPDTRRRAKGGAPPLQLRCSSAVELLALCCMCTLVMWGLGSRPARMCSHRLPPASLRPPQETPTCWPRCATQWLTRSAHPRLHPPPWPLKLQWQRRSWT